MTPPTANADLLPCRATAPPAPIAWPGWPHLRFSVMSLLLVSLWFAVVYVGSDWWTARRATRVRLYFDAELNIPFVPIFSLPYLSIYALFLGAPFVLRNRSEIVALAIGATTAISVAGVCFLLIPGELAYAPPVLDSGPWAPFFHFADRLNLEYNLAPSLHVALSWLCTEIYATKFKLWGKLLLRSWASLIALSTLLIHQHHVMDVVSGLLLATVIVGHIRPGLVCGSAWSPREGSKSCFRN